MTRCTCTVPPCAPGMRHESACAYAAIDPEECPRCAGDGCVGHATCPVCRGSGLSGEGERRLARDVQRRRA